MSDYPTVRPSLNLNFARTKKLDPRVTFRRASTGTYVDSDGLIKTAGINVPRFDHDPVTGVCKGLLVEESKTNILIWSFGRTLFTRSYATVTSFTGSLVVGEVFTSNNLGTFRLIRYANNIAFFIGISGDQNLGNLPLTAASGSITGISGGSSTYNTALSDSTAINYSPIPVTSVLGNTVDISSGYWRFAADASYKTSGTACVCSIYVKIADPRVKKILLEQQAGGDGDTSRTYTFETGTFSATTGSGSGTGVQGVTVLPNGWYRFYWGRSTISGISPQFYLTAQNSSGATVNGGVYLDGGQIEDTVLATSYIPTAGATVTRSADLASMTGTNFSSWYNQSEGTLYAGIPTGTAPYASNGTLIGLSAGALSSTMSVGNGFKYGTGSPATNTRAQYFSNSLTQFDSNLSINPEKVALAYKINDFSISRNATIASSKTGSVVSSIDQFTILGRASHVISRIAYWPKRLPDTQLQALTRR